MNTITGLEPTLVLETSELAGDNAPPADPKARKPRVWTVFVAWLVAAIVGPLAGLAAYIAVGVAIGFTMGLHGAHPAIVQARIQEVFQEPVPALLLSLIPFQLGLLAVALFAAWLSKEPIKERLGLVPQTGRVLGGFKLASLAAFTLSTGLATVFVTALFLGPAPPDADIDGAMANGSWWLVTLLTILLSVVPALVEELLFRGYILRRLLKRWSPALAIGVTSVLFAIMHMDSVQHIFGVMPFALVVGLLAYRTNSTKPGMVVHAVHNAAFFGFGAVATALGASVCTETIGLVTLGMIGVLGLIGLPAVISLVRSPKPVPAVEAQVAPEPIAESLISPSREFKLPISLSDSRLTSPAV
jgi:membrane protease YdiL (CAAX protease family)